MGEVGRYCRGHILEEARSPLVQLVEEAPIGEACGVAYLSVAGHGP